MKLKVGLFGIGLNVYWGQFEGLEKRLSSYLNLVYRNLKAHDVEVVNLGLIDNVDKAMDAGDKFRSSNVDLLFLYVTTYALSATVLPVVRYSKVPVIILNFSPEPAINYEDFNALKDRHRMTGEWLAYCASCPVPEIANVFKRTGIQFHQITGLLDEKDSCWREVEEWIQAAKVARSLARNRLGLMGTYYSGMLDIYTDLTQVISIFGGHIEHIEVDELSSFRKNVTTIQIEDRVEKFKNLFDIDKDCNIKELERAAKTSVALDLLVNKYKLGSMAYYYKGSGIKENEDTMSSIIIGSTFLTTYQIPVAGEYEVKNALAMKILDCFGVGGSFTEYYAMDYNDDVVLMGHDGPGHYQISQGKIKVKPLKAYHGKVGDGLSVEMSVKYGPVTILSVIEQQGGNMAFLLAEAESVAGPILEIGNTNSRYRFTIGARKFVESWNNEGPAHHCAIGIGHIAGKIKKLGKILGIETIQIC